jgi:hypothetical protein
VNNLEHSLHAGHVKQPLHERGRIKKRVRWSKREIELLGKRPDGIVARMLGRSRYAVQLKRHSLGVPQCWEGRRPWTPKEEALLGTKRDAELAKRLNRTILSVRTQRLLKTKVRFIKRGSRVELVIEAGS